MGIVRVIVNFNFISVCFEDLIMFIMLWCIVYVFVLLEMYINNNVWDIISIFVVFIVSKVV